MKPPTPTIIVDTREQLGYLTGWRFPIVRTGLQTGDYTVTGETPRVVKGEVRLSVSGIEKIVRAERKSLGDLASSCTLGHDRFDRELERMKGFEYAMLFVEATLDDIINEAWRSEKTKAAHVLGALAAWKVRYRTVSLLFGGSRQGCQAFVERWLEQVARHVCERYAAARAIVDAFE